MSEATILTTMCMIYDDAGNVLVQERMKKDWPGITFPGGKVEQEEPFMTCVKREVLEETGLQIDHVSLCGVKQFQTAKDERYIVFLYKTNCFQGTLHSSSEGPVYWVKRSELANLPLASDFIEMLPIFEDENYSEFYYNRNDNWKIHLF